ncbi:glutamate--tRNA ligase [Candidatus Parcubacteria bacterium]|nr:glutamate--tRNA ligase [Candidatus Parcubacteria bacterium]
MDKIKTRFPPSPTGFLHIGSLRTALYNYYFARKHGGAFVLRIEDTDRSRYVEGAVESLLRTLKRMEIDVDEGPFVQSERLEIYRAHAQQLVQAGHAYRCFCSKERLEELRAVQQTAKQPTKYDRACLTLATDEVEARIARGDASVVRMRIPEGETSFEDEVRGRVTIQNKELDDQVLLKADGFPTYHLAVVVDDHLMGITHVIRGEEWISSVPKHILLYQWFGFPLPVFAHLPLILNPDRSKLSKRQGDVSVEDYFEKGFLEEALGNYVSLLGFNPGGDREIYSREELIAAFDLKKLNKSGAVFDVNKLLWMNGQYLKNLPADELALRVRPWLEHGAGDVPEQLLQKVCDVEKTRMSLLSDIRNIIPMYLHQPDISPDLLVWKTADREDALLQLKGVRERMDACDDKTFSTPGLVEETLKRYIEERNLGTGNVLWPLRVALSGAKRSPGPHELAWVLGKEETIRRIDHATSLLA